MERQERASEGPKDVDDDGWRRTSQRSEVMTNREEESHGDED